MRFGFGLQEWCFNPWLLYRSPQSEHVISQPSAVRRIGALGK
jgi:hypothetical protein